MIQKLSQFLTYIKNIVVGKCVNFRLMFVHLFFKQLAMQSVPVKEKKKKKSKESVQDVGLIQKNQQFLLEPSTAPAKLDTSQWPLLLKVSFPISNFLLY